MPDKKWKKHNGKKPPVNPDQYVQVRGDGDNWIFEAKADDVDWPRVDEYRLA